MLHKQGPRPVPLSLLIALRPGQWTKNLFVFAALVFAQRLTDRTDVLRSVVAFLVFCGLSSTVYLVNDVLDREPDQRHPLKANRPVASGLVSPALAITAAAVLGTGAMVVAWLLGQLFLQPAAAYLVLMTAYSLFLKHLVIIDVLTIAAGFTLRAAGGAAAIAVPISHWLLVCTTLLALFIALSKRRHELTLLTETATDHRPILSDYTPYLLDQMISVVTASTLIAYAFYTISPETTQKFGTDLLTLTIPFPLYGLFRYLYLVHRLDKGGSPAELVVNDRPLLICVALWALSMIAIIYR
jgi:4-hydroxybenzoate polyprenyltransferase